MFTMCLLVLTSSISMQLFCYLKELEKFETFPFAFFSMFQILTQEAWPEVMSKTMEQVQRSAVVVTVAYSDTVTGYAIPNWSYSYSYSKI